MNSPAVLVPVAQSVPSDGANGFASAVLLTAVLAVVVTAFALWIRSLKRRWLGEGEEGQSDWSLHDLRRLHAEGQLTDAEFQRLKTTTVASMKAGLDPETSSRDPSETDGGPVG